jgi:glycosyltransferase involved in cell wall biosynthesis
VTTSTALNKRPVNPEGRTLRAPSASSLHEPLTPTLVSVVLIFYNEARFVEEAIISVLAQTFGDWELLLVDDGSTDASTAIARHYAETYPSRVRYLEHQGHANRGTSASRNLGIRNARGAFVAPLDGDDVWLPRKLEEQLAVIEAHPDAGMLYGHPQHWYSWTRDPADVARDHVPDLGVATGVLLDGQLLLAGMVTRRFQSPCPSSILIRTTVANEVGGFEEAFRGMYDDQVFAAKVCLKAKVLVVDRSWERYRQHPDSCYAVARSTGAWRDSRIRYLQWLQRYLAQQRLKNTVLWPTVATELRKMRPAEVVRSRARQLRRVAELICRGRFETIVQKVLGGKAK